MYSHLKTPPASLLAGAAPATIDTVTVMNSAKSQDFPTLLPDAMVPAA
jgi:hypothetical protein